MSEAGCLKDGNFQNIGAVSLNVSSSIDSTYLDFLSGFQGNLTATGIDITVAEALAGVAGGDETAAEVLACTYIKNAVNTHAGDASAPHNLGYLPPALKGDHLVVEITGELDGANAQSLEAVGAVGADANRFSKQVIGTNTGGVAGSAIETLGTAAVPTSQTLIYTPAAAATNFLGPGSMIHFYCPKDSEWLVNVRAVPKGTGATGAFSTST